MMYLYFSKLSLHYLMSLFFALYFFFLFVNVNLSVCGLIEM